MPFKDLKSEISELIEKSCITTDTLLQICRLLKSNVPHCDWVGFYFRNGKKRAYIGSLCWKLYLAHYHSFWQRHLRSSSC